MGNAKIRIGTDQGFIQHLLLLIGHIRDQKPEKYHQLLDLSGQQRIHFGIIHFINKFHLWCHGEPDFHNIDTMR